MSGLIDENGNRTTKTRDRAGNPLSATPLLDAKDSQTYAYDSASRLVSYQRHDGSSQTWPAMYPWRDMEKQKDWSMDGLGNRAQTVSADSGGNQQPPWTWVNTSFNEYYSVGGASLAHEIAGYAIGSDANGNLISEPVQSTRTFRPDEHIRRTPLNRLKADGGSGAVAAYIADEYIRYDAENRRVKKDLAATNADVEYAYDGWLTLEEFDEGQSNLKRQYVHGARMDEMVLIDVNQNGDATASGSGDARYFYHQNLIQSVCALSGASGQIVEAYEYDPYGRHVLIQDGNSDGHVDFDSSDARTVLGVSATKSPFTFTGRDYDGEVDKHHYRNRAYSWQAERFLSRDPAGYEDDWNLFAYAGSRPLVNSDPYGYASWSFRDPDAYHFKQTTTKRIIGVARGSTAQKILNVKCRCGCPNPKKSEWSVEKCEATHEITTNITLDAQTPELLEFVLDGEADHVRNLEIIHLSHPKADAAFKEIDGKLYTSHSSCAKDSASKLQKGLQEDADYLYKASKNYWDNGKHEWKINLHDPRNKDFYWSKGFGQLPHPSWFKLAVDPK